MKGIYIHIPFCTKKCSYCDFVSYSGKQNYQQYVDLLCAEIHLYGQGLKKEAKEFSTLYIGGGTPSLLSPIQVEYILEQIFAYVPKESFKEITIEVNPESIDVDKVKGYLAAGINRISMGIQTFSPKGLILLGRQHDDHRAVEAFQELRAGGCQNINIDLIYSLPGQSLRELKDDLQAFLDLNPEHISTYSLTIEAGTPLANAMISPLEDDEDRALFHHLNRFLEGQGYHRYEVSNFAKKGFESQHNRLVWLGQDYYAFGLAAHGMIEGVRYENARTLTAYQKKVLEGEKPIAHQEKINKEDEALEFLMLRLRLTEGFSLEEYKEKFGVDFMAHRQKAFERLQRLGAIEESGGRVFLTTKGFDVMNSVITSLL